MENLGHRAMHMFDSKNEEKENGEILLLFSNFDKPQLFGIIVDEHIIIAEEAVEEHNDHDASEESIFSSGNWRFIITQFWICSQHMNIKISIFINFQSNISATKPCICSIAKMQKRSVVRIL